MSRQLVAVEFVPGGRSYTYHNDGPGVAVDDWVVVMTDRGPQDVLVVSVNPKRPRVPTKPIVGKSDRKPRRSPVQEKLL